MTNSHNRNNDIEVLHNGDIIISNQVAIKKHAVNFFEHLFKEDYS